MVAVRFCWRMAGGFLALAAVPPAGADQGTEGPTLYLTWENDALRGADRHFTQGGRILYMSGDEGPADWMRRLSGYVPTLGFDPEALKYGVEVGQEIYTPEDLDAVNVVPDDRPYAGWLYVSMLLQRRGRTATDIYAMETLRIDAGLVGKQSLAEGAQKVWHSRDPQGWDNQLKTEPGLILRYDRDYLFRWRNWGRCDFDILPGVDAALGNIDIHAGLRATARAGYNIPNRHEVPGRPTSTGWGAFGAYMFVTGGGKAVVHSIFLDGNTWQDSHSVERDPWVATLRSGVGLALGPFEVLASHHYVTREFATQKHSDSYGSVVLAIKF